MQVGRTRGGAQARSRRGHDTTPLEMELDKAYHRGRNDERGQYVERAQPTRYAESAQYVQRGHGSHPLLVFAVFLVALAGAVLIILSIQEGSFSKGGALVDQQLSGAVQQPPVTVKAEVKPTKAKGKIKAKTKGKVQPAEGDWVVARR